jgi:Protein of unknown function (DUF4435)
MRPVISVHSVANAVRLSRQLKRTTTALLLEGNTDFKLYRNLIDGSKCQTYSVEGKQQVIAVLNILKKDKIPGVLAIVDADADHLEGTVSNSPDVITTETRDVEGLLLRSPALEKVLNEHGGTSQFPPLARDLILDAALPLGYLRCVAIRNRWSLDFKILNFGAFVDPAAIKSDVRKTCEEVSLRNPGFGRTADDLLAEISRIADSNHDKWQVAQGHDMVAILAKAVSFRSKKQFYGHDLEAHLRLAFEATFLVATKLYEAICAWQKRNLPFVVIKLSCPSEAAQPLN